WRLRIEQVWGPILRAGESRARVTRGAMEIARLQLSHTQVNPMEHSLPNCIRLAAAFLLLGTGATDARAGIVFAKIADTNTAIPGGVGTFAGFMGVVLSGSNVAFWGSDFDTQTGYYADVGGGLQVVADENTPVPGGPGTFNAFDSVAPAISG